MRQLVNFSFPKFGTPRRPVLLNHGSSPIQAALALAPAPLIVVETLTFLVTSVTWTVLAEVVTLADRLMTSPAEKCVLV
jgi:hypothetical protein